jgi:hypothetical protein
MLSQVDTPFVEYVHWVVLLVQITVSNEHECQLGQTCRIILVITPEDGYKGIHLIYINDYDFIAFGRVK